MICIYPAGCTDFSSNGLGAVTPMSCTVTETLNGEWELMITIMSSLAQEESRSISENVTWGWRRRIADGKVSMAYGRFLGYDRGEDGTPVVNEKEAETVRQIYGLFPDGQMPSGIADLLTK